MSQADQPIEWYLARDGQQHGPISAAEMNKIIELGYLLPTDLVWRQGLADWQPASEAFPKPSEPRPAAAPPPPTPPAQSSAGPARSEGKDPKADTTGRDRAQIAKDPASWDAEARRQSAARGSEGGSRQGPTETRDVIAAEAARREEAARRSREAAARQASAGGTAGRQTAGIPSSGQAASDPADRSGMSGGGHGPGAHRPRPAAVGTMTPQAGPAAEDDNEEWSDGPSRRRFPKVAIAAVLLVALLGGGVFALHATGRLDPIVNRISSASAPQVSTPPVVSANPDAQKAAPTTVGYSNNPADVDRQFQRSPLWQLLKAEFPDWYAERVRDTARLKGEGKADNAIAQHLAEQLVALRRKHVTDALAASPQNLKSVASTFLENLERLSRHSVDACYGFISQGETNPLIVELTRASEHTQSLQRQAAAIFTAIVEGRRTPAQHRQPTRDDYDQLAMQLAKRGWSPMDLQLFSDARSLARAAPDRVCRMVQDWFAAQLAVSDEEVRVRLLIEALKPVVAG